MTDTSNDKLLLGGSVTVPDSPLGGWERLAAVGRTVIFLFVAIKLSPGVALELLRLIAGSSNIQIVYSVRLQFLFEITNFLLLLAITWLFGVLEHRGIEKYGLPIRNAFGRKFWVGFFLGLIEVSLLVGLIALFGGYSFGTLALRGADVWIWGLFYFLFFLFVGLYEEYLFRGYPQTTLTEGIGFWPAAVFLSILFGAVHGQNSGETWIGLAGVLVAGLVFAYTLSRTGDLWCAVGMHASFDWGQTFLFSVPDSGLLMPGHLSNATLHGKDWLTGGTVGPEGSVFCFLTMGLQFLVVMWLFPKTTNVVG